MGLFSSESSYERVGLMKHQKAGRDFLQELLGQEVDLPRQGVAGLSEAEQAGQDILSRILSGEAFADPRTSPLYQGLRAESQAEEADAVSALRRRGQMGGMLRSSPNARAEADLRSNFSNQRQTMLGGLYEAERARDNPYTRLQAASTYGALPRLLSQAEQDAAYQEQYGETMAPYNMQAPIASTLFQYATPMMQTEASAPLLPAMTGLVGDTAGGVGGVMAGIGGYNLGQAKGNYYNQLAQSYGRSSSPLGGLLSLFGG